VSADLDRTKIGTLLEDLIDAHVGLLRLPLMDRIEALGRVASRWLSDSAGIGETAEAISTETGYDPDMVAECLRRTLAAWNASALTELVERGRTAPGSVATPVATVVAVLAQNTPGIAVAPTFTSLALGSAILLKSSGGEKAFAPRLIARIAAEHEVLGRACAVRRWQGGDPLEEDLFGGAGRVVVYGPQAAIDRARSIAGERVIACGPRTSLAVVAGGDCTSISTRLAREVAFLDQRGCLSPQVALVSADMDLQALARSLAHELENLESKWPRRRLDPAAATTFRREIEETENRALTDPAIELLGGTAQRWAVAVESETSLRPGALDRFIRLHPFDDLAALERALAPLRGRLECVGLATGELDPTPYHDLLRRVGTSRICAIGEMQDPPARWHSGARRPVADYLQWSEDDDADLDATLPADFLRYVAQTSESPRGIEVVRARGSWVEAREGRRYLDLLSGIGVASIGHAHPRVAAAVAEQSARYTHVMVYGEDVLAPQVDLARRLAHKLPAKLEVSYFTNSGAEAIEGALKLVRKATGRTRVAAFEGAYHGDTTGAMALGGNPFYRAPFEPLVGPVDHLPWNDPSALDRIDESTAAVFAEPVQAEAGVRIPDPDFLPRLARRCREVGALLVFDEVVTALGRIGRWFGFEHWPGSEPDVIVMAKSLGGGLPLGAFLTSLELSRHLANDPPLGHVTTFGGNPVSCAAGLAALDVLEDADLPRRSADLGEEARARLARRIGRGLVDVRGIGLLLGLEFDSPKRVMAFTEQCRARGLLLGWTLNEDRVIRLAPPLNIDRADLDHALDTFEDILDG
jgi:acetylornithine/N-succinyldiaminopimelate aminotransferase